MWLKYIQLCGLKILTIHWPLSTALIFPVLEPQFLEIAGRISDSNLIPLPDFLLLRLWVIANEAVQESLNSWQISIQPLAKVVLENRIVLDYLSFSLSLSLFFIFFLPDYLLTKQGGICAMVSIIYCTWINTLVKSRFRYITFNKKSIGYNTFNLFHLGIWFY